MLQITIGPHASIFNLDDLLEIDSIENIDSCMEPNSAVDTGFTMTSSREYNHKQETWIHRTRNV